MSDYAKSDTVDVDRFPEWKPFTEAVGRRRPDAGTWCEAWTVRDIVIHQTGNAEALARVLAGHLEGEPVSTRGFDEREAPYRAMNDADLWAALGVRMAWLSRVTAAADDLPDETEVAWTGRTMKVPWFGDRTGCRGRSGHPGNGRRRARPAAVGATTRRPQPDLQQCRSCGAGPNSDVAQRLLMAAASSRISWRSAASRKPDSIAASSAAVKRSR